MIALDLRLVQGLADVKPDISRKVMLHDPVAAHFRKDGSELWYAAPLHVEDERSPGFRMLLSIFDRFPIGDVVIEGSPYSLGELSGRHLETLVRTNERGLYENGERGYAAKLASERGISVIGGEPSDREIAAELIARGYEPRDVLGLGFICYLDQWRRLGILDRMSAARLFQREMPSIRRAHGLGSAAPFDYNDLLRWYEERNGKCLDVLRWRVEPLTPLKTGEMGTQRISHAVNMLRNRTIARVLNERLQLKQRVLAVFGNGHLACHWRALTAAFGEPISLANP